MYETLNRVWRDCQRCLKIFVMIILPRSFNSLAIHIAHSLMWFSVTITIRSYPFIFISSKYSSRSSRRCDVTAGISANFMFFQPGNLYVSYLTESLSFDFFETSCPNIDSINDVFPDDGSPTKPTLTLTPANDSFSLKRAISVTARIPALFFITCLANKSVQISSKAASSGWIDIDEVSDACFERFKIKFYSSKLRAH